MVSAIVDILDLDANVPDGKFMLAVKDDRNDLGFVFGEIISNLLKKDYALIVINLVQSFNHYNHLFAKFGINVKQLREKKKLYTIDVLSEVKQLINPSNEVIEGHVLKSLCSESEETPNLKLLYQRIEESVNLVLSNTSTTPAAYILFIDEINVLLNLGYEIKAIHPFMQYCQTLCLSNQDVPGVLLTGCINHIEDKNSTKLVNYLSHMADVIIRIESLATGYSTVAHGKISTHVNDKSVGIINSQKFLYKVEDKGAKLLPLAS